jgi:hypothetical protein
LCADPFTHDPIGEPQVRHRILGPLIAHALGLRGISGLWVIPVSATVYLALLYLFARRWQSPAVAAGIVLLISTTPVVYVAQTWLGYPDILGHLAILVCLMTRAIWPVAPVLFLGMLGDERCAAAYPLVVLWHFWNEPPDVRWRRAAARVAASMVAAAAWYAVYRWIQVEFVIPTGWDQRSFSQEVLSGKYLREGKLFIPLGVFYALRGAWLFPILLTGVWARRPDPIRSRVMSVAAYWAAAGTAIGQGVVVMDVNRCVALCWPAVLIAIRYLSVDRPVAVRHWLTAALVLNLFTPAYNVYGTFIHPVMPLPVALATAAR